MKCFSHCVGQTNRRINTNLLPNLRYLQTVPDCQESKGFQQHILQKYCIILAFVQARQTRESTLSVRLDKNSFSSNINLRRPFINQWKEHRMDNHHKDPVENHHYMHGHDGWHIYYLVRNIKVAQTLEFFLGWEDFLDFNDLLSANEQWHWHRVWDQKRKFYLCFLWNDNLFIDSKQT